MEQHTLVEKLSIQQFSDRWDDLTPILKIEIIGTLIMDYALISETSDLLFSQKTGCIKPTLILYGQQYQLRDQNTKKPWNPLTSFDDMMMVLNKMFERGFAYHMTNQDKITSFCIYKIDNQSKLYSRDSGHSLLDKIAYSCIIALIGY